jgi:uncharacterized protein YegP (UPF0339 family)
MIFPSASRDNDGEFVFRLKYEWIKKADACSNCSV